MDEIHDMIQKFNTATDGIDQLLDILDKLNDKMDRELSEIRKIAIRADTWAGMNRPLGGI